MLMGLAFLGTGLNQLLNPSPGFSQVIAEGSKYSTVLLPPLYLDNNKKLKKYEGT